MNYFWIIFISLYSFSSFSFLLFPCLFPCLFPLLFSALQVAYASSWSQMREHPEDLAETKPYDWTFTPDYIGTITKEGAEGGGLVETNDKIDIELLKRPGMWERGGSEEEGSVFFFLFLFDSVVFSCFVLF